MNRQSVLLVLGMLLAPQFITQAIEVSGPVSGTWTAANNPYLVVGDLVVPADSTLVIAPEVRVYFQGQFSFTVSANATLQAEGAPGDTILFTATNTGLGWKGFKFLDASDSTQLEFCHITHCFNNGSNPDSAGALYCFNSNPTIQHCRIDTCTAPNGGAIYCTNSSPIIRQNLIKHNTAFLGRGGGIYCCNNSNPHIEENDLEANYAPNGGALMSLDSGPLITQNNVIGNSAHYGGGGVYLQNSSAGSLVNNLVHDNTSDQQGGGLFLYGPGFPVVSGNTITYNVATGHGGGIWCDGGGSPVIVNNTIDYNASYETGGGIRSYGCNSIIISNNSISHNYNALNGGAGLYIGRLSWTITCQIINNQISSNFADASRGGGIYAYNCGSASLFCNNVISGNTTSEYGGGLYLWSMFGQIKSNIIDGNEAAYGGGIASVGGNYFLEENEICENHAVSEYNDGYGGGLYLDSSVPLGFSKNTFYGNTATQRGKAIYAGGSSELNVLHSIIGNEPSQPGWPIYVESGSTCLINYSDIMSGWPTGQGNINQWPAFVDTSSNDFRLQWDSPCIDAGNSSVIYYDPDGTRADMGCYYYDQSDPITLYLIPQSAYISIPAAGGSFNYTVQITNIQHQPCSAQVWCNVEMPSGTIYGPVQGPIQVIIPGNGELAHTRTQVVPATAPGGWYNYRYFVGTYNGLVLGSDDFNFFKQGTSEGEMSFGGWDNFGESFTTDDLTSNSDILSPSDFAFSLHPNPFNPSTTISYQLPAASHVQLSVYDISGRLVQTLVNGYRQAGNHEVTFDGSNLASGIYLYRLQAGPLTTAGKMILLK